MNCQTCGEALGRGTAAHHLTCRYCGAVHSNRPEVAPRPYEAAIEAALDETGALRSSDSQSIDSFELNSQCFSSTAEVPADVRGAIDDASRALDDIFGGPPMETQLIAPAGGAAEKAIATKPAAPSGLADFPEIAPTRQERAMGSTSNEETAPMPPQAADEILAAAQAHSHAECEPLPMASAPEPSAPQPPPPIAIERPAPSRVTMASDPAEAEEPQWMRHAVVITAIAVIGMFTLAGVAIVVLH